MSTPNVLRDKPEYPVQVSSDHICLQQMSWQQLLYLLVCGKQHATFYRMHSQVHQYKMIKILDSYNEVKLIYSLMK